jgi:hypothetical protein
LSNPPCEDDGMNRKEKFLSAVQILAPGDSRLLNIAHRVREEELPAFPGGAAIEFVVCWQRLARGAPGAGLCQPLPAGASRVPDVRMRAFAV